jgi:chromosome segregation ATPase
MPLGFLPVRGSVAGRDGSGPGLRQGSEEGAVSELDRLEAAMNECREMIRDAHAATKDLRAAVREARQEARTLAADEVATQIQAEVSRQLEELSERTGEAINTATQKVIAEFDRFGEALLGKETYWQKASGRRSAARPDTDVVSPDLLPGDDQG